MSDDINNTPSPIKSSQNRGNGTLKHLAEYAQFIIWIATPEPYRILKKQEDFARSVGLSESMLADWKKRDDFKEAVNGAMREFLRDKTANAMAALYKKILSNGNAAEVKLWLQYVEDWREEQPYIPKFDDVVSEEDLIWYRKFEKKNIKPSKK